MDIEGYVTKECPACFIRLTLPRFDAGLKICMVCKFDHVEDKIKELQPGLLARYKDMSEAQLKALVDMHIKAVQASFDPYPIPEREEQELVAKNVVKKSKSKARSRKRRAVSRSL